MKKKLVILGVTGSIGKNVLSVLKNLNGYRLTGVSVNKNIEDLTKILGEISIDGVCIVDKNAKEEFEKKIGTENGIRIYTGNDGLIELIEDLKPDIVLNALVGTIGLFPTIKAIECGADIALANKEAMVVGGEIITKLAREKNVKILPVDSEHNAIWQCIIGEEKKNIKRVILTASGGPFLDTDIEKFDDITVGEALDHPNWSMGKKITIDSATMMNKGLEVIEAKWLFDLSPNQIEILIHPQSIIHSMVEFIDGSIKAQMGVPDMRMPIQYALTYPNRVPSAVEYLNLAKMKKLSFRKVDTERYPCVRFAYNVLKVGGTAPAVLNKSNEIAVKRFLNNQLKFTDIPKIIEGAINKHTVIENPSLEDLLKAEKWTEQCLDA